MAEYVADRAEERKYLIDEFARSVDEMLAMPYYACTVSMAPIESFDGKYVTRKAGWPVTFELFGADEPFGIATPPPDEV